MAEHDDHPERSTPTTEGVRILGAQEAAAIEADRRAAMGEEDATEALPVTYPTRAGRPRHHPDLAMSGRGPR